MKKHILRIQELKKRRKKLREQLINFFKELSAPVQDKERFLMAMSLLNTFDTSVLSDGNLKEHQRREILNTNEDTILQ